MKNSHFIFFATIVFSFLFGQSCFAKDEPAKSLCSKNESILFSCSYKKKVVSLCASQSLDSKTGYIQYRASNRGKLELEFPSVKKHPLGIFAFELMPRGGKVIFSNGAYQYTLSSDLEDRNFVTVEKKGKVLSEFKCFDTDSLSNLTMTSVLKKFESAGLSK